MTKLGSGLLVAASLMWLLGYIGIIFQSFFMLIFAIGVAAVGAIILFIGVLKDRMKEKKEDEDHDYREY